MHLDEILLGTRALQVLLLARSVKFKSKSLIHNEKKLFIQFHFLAAASGQQLDNVM